MLKRRPALEPECLSPSALPPPAVSQATSMLRPREVAAMLSVTVATLRAWRGSGKGPLFVRCAHGVTRYPKDGLITWLEAGAGPR